MRGLTCTCIQGNPAAHRAHPTPITSLLIPPRHNPKQHREERVIWQVFGVCEVCMYSWNGIPSLYVTYCVRPCRYSSSSSSSASCSPVVSVPSTVAMEKGWWSLSLFWWRAWASRRERCIELGTLQLLEVVFFEDFPSRELHRYDGFLPPRPEECIIVTITTLFLVAGLSLV